MLDNFYNYVLQKRHFQFPYSNIFLGTIAPASNVNRLYTKIKLDQLIWKYRGTAKTYEVGFDKNNLHKDPGSFFFGSKTQDQYPWEFYK